MRSYFGRRQFAPVFAICFLVPAVSAFGQAPAPASGTPSAGSTPSPSGNVGTNGSINNNNRTTNYPGLNNPQNQQQQQQMPTPIFLSGRVMMDDGSQPDRDIRIERVCGGSTFTEGHADSKGRFSFQLGQNASFDMDASNSSMGSAGGFGNSPGGFGGNSNTGSNPFGSRMGGANLTNCELRASYPGYRSDVVPLLNRRPMDPPDVGMIVLHHLGNVQGTTISLTTALAPKDARKDYEKAIQLAEKGKYEEAMKRLANATEVYPKYAIAWYAIGQLQQKQGDAPNARQSYEKALAADSRYVSPLNQLALLSAQAGKWEDAAKYSKQAISLNPVEFPSAFWYNALANYNLKRGSDAEKSTKDLLKLDSRHRYPEAENLMAQLLLDAGNFPEAANHLRSYLTLVPNAKNADVLKQMLLKIDAAQTAAPTSSPAPVKP